MSIVATERKKSITFASKLSEGVPKGASSVCKNVEITKK